MNTKIKKKLISNLFLITLSLTIFSCKKETKNLKVIEIFSGILIEKDKFHYSEESVLNLNNKNYWLRHKGIYESKGTLIKVISYGTEGIHKNSRKEMVDDPKLLKSLGYPLNQNWLIIDNHLKTDNTNLKVQKLTNDIYATNLANRYIFYKVKP